MTNFKTGFIVVVSIAVVIFGIAFVSEFFQTVQPSYKGLVIKWGQLQEDVLSDGFHLKTPFWTDIVSVFVGQNSTDNGVNVQAFRNIEPLSKDGQIMIVDAQIEYSITNPVLYRRTTGVIDPMTIESLVLIPQFRRLLYDYCIKNNK